MHIMFWRPAAGPADGQGASPPATCRPPTPTAPPAARLHGADAAVPRHRVQLPPAPGHAHRRARSCSRTSGTPARALELIEREGVTNFSGVPTMSRELLDASRLGDARHLHAAGDGRRRRAAAARPRREDRQVARRPACRHRLRPDRDARHRHRQRGRSYVAKPSSCGPVVPTLDAKLVDETATSCRPAGGRASCACAVRS